MVAKDSASILKLLKQDRWVLCQALATHKIHRPSIICALIQPLVLHSPHAPTPIQEEFLCLSVYEDYEFLNTGKSYMSVIITDDISYLRLDDDVLSRLDFNAPPPPTHVYFVAFFTSCATFIREITYLSRIPGTSQTNNHPIHLQYYIRGCRFTCFQLSAVNLTPIIRKNFTCNNLSHGGIVRIALVRKLKSS